MSTVLATHSKKGASSAERWMNCPGSNVIVDSLKLEKTDETEFAAEGTAAHEAASHCLVNALDAWEVAGKTFHDLVVTAEMASAFQLYLDTVRSIRDEHGPGVTSMVEARISGDFDELFYGTVDSAEVSPGLLDITDYKHGKGIAVDAKENAQLMYYAVGILEKLQGHFKVRLRIVQPRAFHAEGPVRKWETTSDYLREWRDKELIPAMARAGKDMTLIPGEHCRFCPSKIVCPLLTGLFKVAMTTDASFATKLDSASLALQYQQIEGVKHFIRGLEAEVMKRLQAGETVSGGDPDNTFKLVYKKADRVFKPEGVAILTGKNPEIPAPFKAEDIYETKLKSVAGIADLGAEGKKFVKEYAYTPQNGLTVAASSDKRPGVKVQSPQEAFGDMVQPTE